MRSRLLFFLLPASGLTLDLEGSCDQAVDLMAFHRDKMHEYQCRRYLAEEIVDEDRNLQKRDGTLLLDEGSSKYTDWLARSSTLEDIYRHYEQDTAADAPIGSSVPSGFHGGSNGGYPGGSDGGYNSGTGYPGGSGGYQGGSGGYPGGFDGEVTGYAMLGNNKVAQADSTGYGVGTSYGVPQYGGGGGGGGGISKAEKAMKLQDIFQLALTAIAFLAFGTFIIEVFMCIMGVELKDNDIEIIMMTPNEPLQAANNNHFFKNNERRVARSVQQMVAMQTLQAMAEKATNSLDALQHISSDNGQQLEEAICSAASLSRVFNGTSRLWPPLWSFGMSWVGGRHTGTLKYLTATVRGLAGTNCMFHATKT